MLHEEMFYGVNATKENVYDCIKSEKVRKLYEWERIVKIYESESERRCEKE
jgi:predicted DNA-binding protein YlxM (UPF0122 family)